MDENTQALTNRGLPIKLLIIGFMIFSAAVAFIAAFFSAQKISRDQVRVRDIQILQAFLMAYKNNNGIFPQATGGMPASWQDYLDFLPQAPAPDGNCTTAENNYQYSPTDGGAGFRLGFCLGSKLQNYRSGPNIAGPN